MIPDVEVSGVRVRAFRANFLINTINVRYKPFADKASINFRFSGQRPQGCGQNYEKMTNENLNAYSNVEQKLKSSTKIVNFVIPRVGQNFVFGNYV
jgi:hypothetical protein